MYVYLNFFYYYKIMKIGLPQAVVKNKLFTYLLPPTTPMHHPWEPVQTEKQVFKIKIILWFMSGTTT